MRNQDSVLNYTNQKSFPSSFVYLQKLSLIYFQQLKEIIMKRQNSTMRIKGRGSVNIAGQTGSSQKKTLENKENSQYPLNQLYSLQAQVHHRHINNDESYFTIKKPTPSIRQSQYFGLRSSSNWNSKCFRFSQHAERIRSTNPSLNSSQEQSSCINNGHQPMTFGHIKQNLSVLPVMSKQNNKIYLEDNKSLKCFNHFNKQAKFYLLLAEKEQDGSCNKLYYCDKCAINIKQQGFVIHAISNSPLQSPPFLNKLNECIFKITQNIQNLAAHPYLQQIQWKANEVSKKYDTIIEALLQFKKQELLQIEKYKFQVFQYVTRRQKELEGALKKLQLLNESYLKNCYFEEEKEQENENQLYWGILQKQKYILDVNINAEIKKIKLNDSSFLDELELCEKLVSTFKERVYELSFDEDDSSLMVDSQKTQNILDGLNATFGEKQQHSISFYE